MIYVGKNDLHKKSKDELVDDLYDSLVEIDKLKRELRKYKNPNTPSSANQHLKPSLLPYHSRKKRGAPLGHPAFNRPWNSNTTPYHIIMKECPNCHSDDIDVLRTARQQIDEIPKEIKPESKIVERDICQCNKCKFKFSASDGETPKYGRFGINLMVLTIMLRFIVRGVMRKTASFLDASFAVKLAPASVQAIITRAAQAGQAEYGILKIRIRAALRLHVDETSFSVLGQKWWVWIFRSDTDKLIVIRHSRGNNVLEEILGKDYAGVVHCDCWRAYDYLVNATLQRCWAHLLRKSAELKTKVTGKHFHDKLTTLFDEIKTFNNKERTLQERREKYENMTAQLKKITQYYARYEDCKAVNKYINFHIESWFTCIKHENVEPTNNNAEQAIRETVIVRKIIGAFRSTHGIKTYETLASLIATWTTQQKDIRQELHRMLTTQLC
jgi:transposase